jgi:hypothetical protein
LGWLNWFVAETIAVGAALLNLIWVPFIALDKVAVPDVLLTFPIIAAFFVTLVHFACAYRMRVAVTYWQMLGAMIVFMSVQWTVASAAFKAALAASQSFFYRTRKGGGVSHATRIVTMPEMLLGTLLAAGAATIFAVNVYRHLEADLFATILLLQSLPFFSAVALVWLERLGDRKLKSRCCTSGNLRPNLKLGRPERVVFQSRHAPLSTSTLTAVRLGMWNEFGYDAYALIRLSSDNRQRLSGQFKASCFKSRRLREALTRSVRIRCQTKPENDK